MPRVPRPAGGPPLIGIRGTPTGPRADLSKIDTGETLHKMFIKIVPKPAPGAPALDAETAASNAKSAEFTKQVLQYVHDNLDAIRRMGIKIQIEKIAPDQLANEKLKAALKARGITRLPAVVTPVAVYLGVGEIIDLYQLNLREFAAVDRRGPAPAGPRPGLPTQAASATATEAEDDLDAFYREEMTMERAEEDADETGLGDAGDMMEDFRRVAAHREERAASRQPGKGPPRSRDSVSASLTSVSHRPRTAELSSAGRPPMGGRPDNVRAGPPRAAAGYRAPAPRTIEPDDEEISATLDRLAADIDEGTHARAFTGGGGDSLQDDEPEGGTSSAQDDLMEKAFWGNRVGVADE